MLTPEELQAERAAYIERQRPRIDAAIAAVRTKIQGEVADGGPRFPWSRRMREDRTRRCEKAGCGARFLQKRGPGRPARYCLEHRS